MNPRHRYKWLELGLALGVGTVAALLLAAVGSPSSSWLGFLASGLAFSGGVRCASGLLRPEHVE